ncbi:hypothetical protein D3C75_220610 [compost metagenome]
MEHRGDRHVDVVAVQAPLAGRAAECGHRRKRVQHQLPMAEIHPFGQARGAGRIERRGAGVLVEVREADDGRGLAQSGFILGHEARWQRANLIGQQNARAQIRQLFVDGFQHRQEFAVGQEYPRAAVIERIGNLLRRQADVHHHQHRSDHRHGEIAFQIAVAVPIHHCHGIAALYPQRGQQPGQLSDARLQGAVVEAHLVAVDDFLLWTHCQRRQQQLLDQQGKGVGLGSGRVCSGGGRHVGLPGGRRVSGWRGS